MATNLVISLIMKNFAIVFGDFICGVFFWRVCIVFWLFVYFGFSCLQLCISRFGFASRWIVHTHLPLQRSKYSHLFYLKGMIYFVWLVLSPWQNKFVSIHYKAWLLENTWHQIHGRLLYLLVWHPACELCFSVRAGTVYLCTSTKLELLAPSATSQQEFSLHGSLQSLLVKAVQLRHVFIAKDGENLTSLQNRMIVKHCWLSVL